LGVVYEIDASGHETVLHSFTGGGDGGNPEAGVALDTAGNLYGTAAFGGAGGQTGLQERVVFKLDSSGRETLPHSSMGPAPSRE
jgi:hypothetical protein